MKILKLRGVSIIIDKQSPYFAHDRAAILQVLFAGNYDRLLESLSEGDVVIDAGANIGCFTLLAARKVGARGIVIAIEPGPNNYKRLKSNVEINGFKNVILVREALDRESKDSRLFREGGWIHGFGIWLGINCRNLPFHVSPHTCVELLNIAS